MKNEATAGGHVRSNDGLGTRQTEEMMFTDMPDVQDLRKIARDSFEKLRSKKVSIVSQAMGDLAFAKRELKSIGMVAVYEAEYRRHELLLRGFTPPEDLDTPNAQVNAPLAPEEN